MKPQKRNLMLFSALVAWIVLITNRKSVAAYARQKVWDLVTEIRIRSLHPLVQDKARAFINKAEAAGIHLRVTSAHRSYSEQNKLYAQGRTTPGTIVTNARGGESYHNFGLAIDVVPIVNGKADWNTDWNRIAAIGKSEGFSWGGDWTSFKDKPHFQMNFGQTLAQLRNKYNNGLLSDGHVILSV